MGRKTYIVLMVVLTVALTCAFGAIALADSGNPASKAASGSGTVTGSSGPSLANNINPAPGDTAGGGNTAGGDTAGSGNTAGDGTAGGGNTAEGETADGNTVKDTAGVDTSPGSSSGFILASNGYPSATVPSSGNTTLGAAAGMFGDPVHGLAVYAGSCSACHGTAGQPTLAFPGLADVQNPNTNYSIDPELYDINPAWFARNIDPFLQHGSNPAGPPAPMPAFGDLQLLSQSQIADAEAYVMGLSNVKWPRLSLSDSVLIGSDFVPQSTVQLYLNGVAFGSPIVIDASGNFIMALTIPMSQSAVITANYAILNVTGIHANGDPEQPELGLDADRGAAFTVARIVLGAAPAAPAVQAAVLPLTGFGLLVPFALAAMSILGGAGLLVAGALKR